MTIQQDGSGQEHLAAIYVHAGAGYHNHSNENLHLQVCANAAQVAMLILKSGGSAIEAVEMAVRCLEDNDITNAGFGSNLTMDGTVEGDATVVDHLGRSGAVGAITSKTVELDSYKPMCVGSLLTGVPGVRNPISVARLVYEHSLMPMELKRVPPNLLTGQGATRFAQEQGINLEGSDALVSRGSHSRWERWKLEIDTAQKIRSVSKSEADSQSSTPIAELKDVEAAMQQGAALSSNPIIAALGNESQPPMPIGSPDPQPDAPTLKPTPLSAWQWKPSHSSSRRQLNRTSQIHHSFDSNQGSKKRRLDEEELGSEASSLPSDVCDERHSADFDRVDESDDDDDRLLNMSLDGMQITCDESTDEEALNTQSGPPNFDTDFITDTVGAIAVDKNGLIAAASSSGGIGMKHSGRTGPAALVGIGTAVIPVDPEDEEQTTVACVTSGTGEHMASTMAAHTCATRVHTSTKIRKAGQLVETNEDDAMQSFVKRDFMGHPAVTASHSGGAIGAMLVKKSRDGMWLYWVHNTDSFALASMHTSDEVPHATMSRNKRAGMIVTGARAMRSGVPTAAKHGTNEVNGPRSGASSKRRRNLRKSSKTKAYNQGAGLVQQNPAPTHLLFRAHASKIQREDGSGMDRFHDPEVDNDDEDSNIPASGGW